MPANTYGRQVVLALVNKSGGGVIAGDVVVIDTANDGAFTTTTSAAFTGGVGVAQETIASNATGRVLLEGYAALVNVSASVTRGQYGTTHTVAKQAVGTASRGAGTFAQWLTGGTTPTARVWPPDLSAGSGMTNPMTTAGDTISGGASGAPTRLAGGTSGYVYTSNGATSAPSWQAAAGGSGLSVAKRQGGDASDWNVGGTTTYTPGSAAVVQVGVTAPITVGGTRTVTFPQAFTNKPWVGGSVGALTVDGTGMNIQIDTITTTTFLIRLGGVNTATGEVRWMAVGI